jgi:small subunit ribosomal protein S16
LKHHLDGGVRKGALTQEQADAKLAAWLEAKSGKVDAKKDGLSKKQAEAKAKALKAETVANEKRANAALEAAKAAEAPEVTEEVAEETIEEVAVETTEEVVAEVAVEETPAVEEAPATEEASEETEA